MKEGDTHIHTITHTRGKGETDGTRAQQPWTVGKSVRYEAVNVNELTFYAVPCCATVVEGLGREVREAAASYCCVCSGLPAFLCLPERSARRQTRKYRKNKFGPDITLRDNKKDKGVMVEREKENHYQSRRNETDTSLGLNAAAKVLRGSSVILEQAARGMM